MISCDITYTTNPELGFDYLIDNMVANINGKVIREFQYAIGYGSLIFNRWNKNTIITGQLKKDVSLYVDVDVFVGTLSKDDYSIVAEIGSIFLTQSGKILSPRTLSSS